MVSSALGGLVGGGERLLAGFLRLRRRGVGRRGLRCGGVLALGDGGVSVAASPVGWSAAGTGATIGSSARTFAHSSSASGVQTTFASGSRGSGALGTVMKVMLPLVAPWRLKASPARLGIDERLSLIVSDFVPASTKP